MKLSLRTDDFDLNFISPQFSAGQTALKWAGGHLNAAQEPGWIYSDLHENLFLAAMHELKASGPVNVVFALPYGWADTVSEKFIAHYRREWRVTSQTRDCQFNVIPSVKKQGSLALLANAYDFDTHKIDMQMLKSAVVIDVGALTTDYLRVIDGKGGNACGSVPDLGIKSVYNSMARWFKSQGIVVTDTEAMKAVEERSFYFEGSVPGVEEQVDALLKKLAHDVYFRVRNDIKDLDSRYPYILITGGAGKLLFPYLTEFMPAIIKPKESKAVIEGPMKLSKNALIDNAVGAAIAASRLSGSFDAAVGVDLGLGNAKGVRVIGDTIHAVAFPSITGDRVFGSEI